ncbi:MAG: hypothetical protein RI947_532 [Candidatus Parcubacteria bacterium]|jgi:hypothetical protein
MGTVNIHTCIISHLKDIYDSEIQLIDALSTMTEHTTSGSVKVLLQKIIGQTELCVERLDAEGEKLALEHDWVPSQGFVGQIQQNNAQLNLVDEPLLHDLEALIALKTLVAMTMDKYESFIHYLTMESNPSLAVLSGQRAAELRQDHPVIIARMQELSAAIA